MWWTTQESSFSTSLTLLTDILKEIRDMQALVSTCNSVTNDDTEPLMLEQRSLSNSTVFKLSCQDEMRVINQ